MPTRDRASFAGARQATMLDRRAGEELRELRRSAGLSQRKVATAAGVSRAYLSRLELGRLRRHELTSLTSLYAVLGHKLTLKAWPAGAPLRDEAQLRLLRRFDERQAPLWHRRHEGVMPRIGDLRAWDERLDGPVSIGVEAETAIGDLQALVRAIGTKRRDSGVERVILLAADTRHNRAVLQAHLPAIRQTFPLATREVLTALGTGRDPGADGIVVL